MKLPTKKFFNSKSNSIQLDFNLPERFKLHYFIGILLEHYGRELPLWLMPVQVKILCLSAEVHDYALEVAEKLQKVGLRVDLDKSSDSLSHKIKKSPCFSIMPRGKLGHCRSMRQCPLYCSISFKLFCWS